MPIGALPLWTSTAIDTTTTGPRASLRPMQDVAPLKMPSSAWDTPEIGKMSPPPTSPGRARSRLESMTFSAKGRQAAGGDPGTMVVDFVNAEHIRPSGICTFLPDFLDSAVQLP